MTYQSKYSRYADVRDVVIAEVIPENEREEITQVMRSVELALIVTDAGKTMKVSREGTASIELYIRYLERAVFNYKKLSIETGPEILLTWKTCSKCDGNRYINQQVKKKRVPVQCPKCNGTGKVRKED